MFAALALLLAAPALASWGDYCNSDGLPGVCVWRNECLQYPKAYPYAGYCPGTPAEVQCCYVPNCAIVEDNRCPGDQSVKCHVVSGKCAIVADGQCPGGSNYKKILGFYGNGNVKCS
ncbi:uncharacterized protein LOC62_01G000069 [Vanrija pseudolonga]|uniref:Uncharacterized protein n=1 Tax=Vanrija pseudolonga TaxID=143232 RepID=A0AAF0XZ46_9TREE|nr:hypothetical protein LOC62_01G000069 [Vanrija pseudolonga]